MSGPFVELPLKRLADCTLGKMVQSGQRGPDDVFAPYLRAAHVQPDGRLIELDKQPMWFSPAEVDALDLRSGDVVVVEGGAGYGRSAVLTQNLPGWGFQNSIIRVRPHEGRTDGRFIDYTLQAALQSGQIENLCNTATIPHFTAEKVANLQIPAPAQPEQRAIADFLDEQTSRIDTLIGKQTQLIDTLRERRIAVIESVIEAREPTTLVRRHVVGIRQGASPNCHAEPADGILEWGVLKTGCSNGGVFRPGENKRLPETEAPRPEHVVRRGEVVMSRASTRAYVGSAAAVKDDFPRLMLSDLNYAVTVRSTLNAEYLVYALASRRARSEIESRTKGTSPSMQKLSQGDILSLPLHVPPVEDQASVVARLDAQTAQIDALIAKAEEFIGLARERRAALITAAVTGQIDVRTAGRTASVGA